MTRDYRVFIYADGIVLPIVIPMSCKAIEITARLRAILAHDIIATRAEVWAGRRKIMTIGTAGIEAMLSTTRSTPSDPETLH